jgi:hypothetical protein
VGRVKGGEKEDGLRVGKGGRVDGRKKGEGLWWEKWWRLRMGERGRVEGRKNWEGLMLGKGGRVEDRRRDEGGKNGVELRVGKGEVKGRKGEGWRGGKRRKG